MEEARRVSVKTGANTEIYMSSDIPWDPGRGSISTEI